MLIWCKAELKFIYFNILIDLQNKVPIIIKLPVFYSYMIIKLKILSLGIIKLKMGWEVYRIEYNIIWVEN